MWLRHIISDTTLTDLQFIEEKRQEHTIVKWLFICMLGGLTLCPLVNGRIFFSVHFNDLKVKKITIL